MRVVIVGGGVMGAAVAFFLAREHGVEVTVLERDLTYRRASSALSASSIRQQFSCAVNIELSRFSFDFLHRWPEVGLVERGYLYLVRPEGVAALREVHAVQRRAGVDVALLEPMALQARFPWLAVDDLALGSLGLSGEGWFDGPALLQALRRASGLRFEAGDVSGFETHGGRVTQVVCRDGRRIDADAVLIAAGAWSAPLTAQLGVPLPVVPKKRDVFVLDSPASLPGCPLVIDAGGCWFRPEGRGFIAGAPPRDGDPDEPPLDAIDHGLFDEVIWPALAARVPAFEALRVRSAWAGYYEMNTFDHNGLAGPLPGWDNAFVACGFSGHGMQQAPALGAALAALMTGDASDAPSIADLHPGRVAANRPLIERNVI